MTDEKRQAPVAWLTRPAVAERLNVSVATVRRLEGRVLHPRKNDSGVWLFASDEVERVAPTMIERKRRQRSADEGEIAARVFELFRHHRDLAAIVIELRQPPHIIRELYDEWRVSLHDGHIERQRARDQQAHERWRRGLNRAKNPR